KQIELVPITDRSDAVKCHDDPIESYVDAVKKPHVQSTDGFTTVARKRQYRSTRNPQHRGLHGVRREKTCTLYVRNIAMESDETPGDLEKQMLDTMSQLNIRAYNVKVVKNKYADDTVGIRLNVTEENKYYLMYDYEWPEYVTCREWFRKSGPSYFGPRLRAKGVGDSIWSVNDDGN
ncbi:unnamed protein product, partial [Owenia fusiformis]